MKTTPMYHAYRGPAAAFALLALAVGPAPFAAQAALPETTAVADPAADVQIPVLEWQRADAKSLLKTVSRASKAGLDPSDYGYDALKLAIDTDDTVAVNILATAAATQLAADYRYGRQARHVAYAPSRGPASMVPFIAEALDNHSVSEAIEGLRQKPGSKS